ncbi:MAG: hypothetical protein R3E79_59385 [Caldilineaceae bacterium]
MTQRDSYKSKHLAANPHVSLAYIADITKPVYIDGTAQWVEDRQQKQRIWDLFKAAPHPLGYDPAPFLPAWRTNSVGCSRSPPGALLW